MSISSRIAKFFSPRRVATDADLARALVVRSKEAADVVGRLMIWFAASPAPKAMTPERVAEIARARELCALVSTEARQTVPVISAPYTKIVHHIATVATSVQVKLEEVLTGKSWSTGAALAVAAAMLLAEAAQTVAMAKALLQRIVSDTRPATMRAPATSALSPAARNVLQKLVMRGTARPSPKRVFDVLGEEMWDALEEQE